MNAVKGFYNSITFLLYVNDNIRARFIINVGMDKSCMKFPRMLSSSG